MKATIQNNNLILSGILDENSDIDDIHKKVNMLKASTPDGERIRVDFNGVQRANSCGIFEWLKIILKSKSSYAYYNCPWWLIQQINMNSEFLPANSIVETLFAPFFSPDSDDNRELLLEIGQDIPIQGDFSDYDFPDKEIEGRVFEPDFDPEDFFDFLTKTHSRYK